MKKNILVVEEKYKPLFHHFNALVLSPMQYITQIEEREVTNANVYNLSAKASYQGIGYYVSLLALARGHRVFPEPSLIQDLKDRAMQKVYSEEFDELVQRKLSKIQSSEFELSIYFGKNLASKYDSLCKELNRIIKAPFFRVYFEKDTRWVIRKIKLINLSEIPPSHLEFAIELMHHYFSKKHSYRSTKKETYYDLAILIDSEETSPPSNKKALSLFADYGKKVGFHVDFITKKDQARLLEYDAIFIRETTNVNHHTYRMARRAQNDGLVVIDDPDSIIKCSNKIFLEELLDRLNIKRPKSVIINKDNYTTDIYPFDYPRIVKRPDSAFSLGVYKARNEAEFHEICKRALEFSELILVQEFLPTDFDWRVGVLNGEVLYVSKYFMAKNHWQIVDNKAKGHPIEGEDECVDPSKAPKKVLSTALKACKLIGRGLYGVDLKQRGEDIYVIEVNDNPNIDHGVEDSFLGEKLYEKMMKNFLDACNHKRKIFNGNNL